MSWQSRSELLLGREAVTALAGFSVAVFGLGGVGSYAAEALIRAGVGHLVLVDGDRYQESNLNRQLGATLDTLGLNKADVTARRAQGINPAVRAEARPVFYAPGNAEDFPLQRWDYIIDAMDRVTAKLELISRARAAGTPVISCMGTGNRLDASRFRVVDLEKTSNCPLARVMRRELNRRGVKHMPVIWSDELPQKPGPPQGRTRGDPPGSVSFVPPVAGMLAAGYVVRSLTARHGEASGG